MKPEAVSVQSFVVQLNDYQ